MNLVKVVSIDEEFKKGRGKDKRPRKRKGGSKDHWSDKKGPMVVGGRYLSEDEANAYRQTYKERKKH
jgi:hypothetical protein